MSEQKKERYKNVGRKKKGESLRVYIGRFSVSEEAAKWVKSQPNMSEYVEKLILADMEARESD